MPLAAEAQAVDPRLLQALLLGGLTAGGVIAAIALRLWRPIAVCGPERLPASMPAVPWLLVVVAATLIWLAAQSAYVGTIAQRDRASTTQQATMPNGDTKTRFSAVDLAVLSTVPPAIGAGVLAMGATIGFPGLIRRLGLDPTRIPQAIGPAILGLLVAVPLVMWVLLGLQELYRRIGYEHPVQHEMLQRLGETARPAVRWAIVAGATVAAPIFEELLFRGGFQTLLRRGFGGIRRGQVDQARVSSPVAVWAAIIVASLLFAMIHEAWMAPAIFALSLCLGYAYERTGNLWVPILMHAIFNAVNVVASLYAAR
jgi:membrane protease YdiL (CAAX protease family)